MYSRYCCFKHFEITSVTNFTLIQLGSKVMGLQKKGSQHFWFQVEKSSRIYVTQIYVKSILAKLEFQTVAFWQFWRILFTILVNFMPKRRSKFIKIKIPSLWNSQNGNFKLFRSFKINFTYNLDTRKILQISTFYQVKLVKLDKSSFVYVPCV